MAPALLYEVPLAQAAHGNSHAWTISVRHALDDAQRQLSEARNVLSHLGRVSIVSILGAGIAHELKQPLAAIKLNAKSDARSGADA